MLGPSLPERPQVIYRGVPPLRLQVAPNVLDAPNRVPFFQNSKGFFPCRKCKVCRINGDKNRKICQFKSNSTTKVNDIDTFITCTSKNVVYLLTCPCGLQYVGRTMRAMNVRIKEHIKNIKKGFPKHMVSRHYLECHNRNPVGTLITAIDRFTPHWRGSYTKREISRLETRWIHTLKCYTPYVLNVEWNVNSFINNS